MKIKFLITACILIATLNSFSQQAEWTVYKTGVSSWYYNDSTCTDSVAHTVNDTTYYCDNTYRVEETYTGLHSIGATSLLQTSNGDIYVGSLNDGLAKFDGTNWTVYTTSNSGLPHNYIRSLLQIPNGDVYVGTSRGLAKFDGTSWIVYDSSNTELPCNTINSIIHTANDDIYVGTYRGPVKFDGVNGTVYNYPNSGVFHSDITSLLEASNGDIYMGEWYGGVCKFDGVNWTVYNDTNSGLPSNLVHSLLQTTNGDLYVGTSGGGLAKFDGVNWTVYNDTNSGLPSNSVYSLVQTTNGDIYAGTSGGLAKFDGINWTVYKTNKTGLLSNIIKSLLQTTNGDLHVGTSGGLAKYDGVDWTGYNSYFDLPCNHVKSLLQTTNGAFYVGTTGGGLAKFDGSDWIVYNTINSGLPSNDVKSLLQTSNGDVFVGTFNGGLVKYDGVDWTVYNYSNSGLPTYHVSSLLQTTSGDVYVGTWGNGLAKFDGVNWTVFNASNSGLPYNQVRSLLQTLDGDICVGTSLGLAKFDGVNWTVFNESNSGLPNNSVNSLMQTNNGDIYVGTNGGGLAKYDGADWTVYRHSNSGLPTNNVNTLLQTTNGDIYVGTDWDGLAKFDGTNWTVYTASNTGLSSDIVYSLIQEKDGGLYIGTARGLAICHDLEGMNQISPNTYIYGKTFFDENKDGIRDFNEIDLKNQKIKLLPDNIYSYTNSNGEFLFNVDSGDYTVQYVPVGNWQLSSDSVSFSVSVDSTSIDTLLFGVKSSFDTTVLSTLLTYSRTRCGFTIPAYLDYSNNGSRIENTIISYTPDENIVFVNSFPAPDSVSTDSSAYYWHQSAFAPCQQKQVQLRLQMPGTDAMGDTLISYATISNDSGFVYTDTLSSIVTCSYDPNDKLVSPAGVMDNNYILMDEELTYTVRFQNTGTDTAFTVVIRDPIDSNLDMNTFAQLASSHDVVTLFDSTGIVSFTFNNILLPDSNVNEPESHGFVSYSIKPKAGLPENTVVKNTGYIFFDFNPAIITNETKNTYVTTIPTSIKDQDITNSTITIIPNPFTNETLISFSNPDNNEHILQVFDITGKMVSETTGITNNNVVFNRKDLNAGMYFYKLKNQREHRVYTGKLVLQ